MRTPDKKPREDELGLFGSGPFYGTARMVRRLLVLLVGGTVLLFGLALLVLPGPALVVIPVGLAILATEFMWARSLLRRSRDRLRGLAGRAGEGSG